MNEYLIPARQGSDERNLKERFSFAAMEKTQLTENTNPSGTKMLMSSHGRRHSHLKSNTYRTLVRILSHFYNDSHCSCADQINVPAEEPKPSDSSDVRVKSMLEVFENSEFVSHGQIGTKDSLIQKEAISEEFNVNGLQKGDLSETKMAVDNLEIMMGLKEDQDSSSQSMMISGISKNTDSKNILFPREQILLAELEHLVNGTEICESKSSNNSDSLNRKLQENQSGSYEVGLINQEMHGEYQQPLMGKSGSSGLSQLEELTNAEDGRNSFLLEEGDMEEGEISDDFCIYDESSTQDAMPEKVNDEQKANEIVNFVADECRKSDNEEEPKSISRVQGLLAHEDGELVSEMNMISEKPGGDNTMVELQIDKFYNSIDGNELETAPTDDQISQWHVLEGKAVAKVATFEDESANAGPQQNVGSSPERMEDEKDTDIITKTKHGPRSEASKAKRKEKKRKQRALKNKKLGIKRLKLTPVLKPKTINYCRHYLQGRCTEGEKCNFSHDAVPLTKSRPCSFFARNACMKGDDCPNDHDLSKYPCLKLGTSGYCHRGDACKFSHKIATNKDFSVAPNDCKSSLNLPPMQGNLKPEQKIGISDTGNLHSRGSGDSLIASNGCKMDLTPPIFLGNAKTKQKTGVADSCDLPSHGSGDCKISDMAQKSRLQAPKGITFLNVPKSSVNVNGLKQRMSLPQSHSENSTQNQIGNIPSVATETVNVVPPKILSTTPKGINFLAFGKSQLDSSVSKGSKGSCLDKSSVISSICKFDLAKPGVCPPFMNNMKIGDGKDKRVHQTFLHSNAMASESAVSMDGMNGLGEATPMLESKSILHSHADDNVNTSVKDVVDTPDNPHFSSLISKRLLFLQGSVRSFDSLQSGSSRNKLDSSQKALLSTLSFAADCEPAIKMK